MVRLVGARRDIEDGEINVAIILDDDDAGMQPLTMHV
ncbi:hypothetical protein CRG98_049188 [Punica granatum]|uniref:Uncharacterized protein n=1 Tax=Punica granatum TaxID=22663 RepID=A0A2I0HFF7_PUNGR|nr:hypothetical protein CRG98_049188 [Punica granatum]